MLPTFYVDVLNSNSLINETHILYFKNAIMLLSLTDHDFTSYINYKEALQKYF